MNLGPKSGKILGKILRKNSNFCSVNLQKNKLGDKGLANLV